MYKKNKNILTVTFFLFVVIFIIFDIYFFLTKQQISIEKKENASPLVTSDIKVEVTGCTRTTRLDNKPPYDRALSLIEEKYKLWEESGEKPGSWYFFPSKLVNCIKVIESNVKKETGAEGQFTFNDSEIKENYFPITVDEEYSYADDPINSLILVHEITHVEQYIKSFSKKDNLSCIDKEVEAFYAQLKFYSIQFSETRKSIYYRIENDNNLHTQLKILSILLNNSDLNEVRNVCVYGEGRNDINCIDNYRKNEIKQMLLQDEFYKKQCEL